MLKDALREFWAEPEIKKIRICFYMLFCVFMLLWLYHGDPAQEICACGVGIIVSLRGLYFLWLYFKRKCF